MGLATPMIPTKAPEDLPSLDPPSKERIHLRVAPGVPRNLCGGGTGKKHSCNTLIAYGEKSCPGCGGRICPTCRAMADVRIRTGITP